MIICYNITVIYTNMLKKGDNFLNNLNITKKSKLYTEPNENFSDFNKENIGSKSLFQNLNDSSLHEHSIKQKHTDQSGYGSAMISPTFQSPDLVNLKDDRFKQDKGYLNINFSLKDMEKTSKDSNKINQHKSTDNTQKAFQEKQTNETRQIQELKRRLIEHYTKKKYWKKIEALFEQEGVDAVLAWQDAIEKYKSVKTSNEQLLEQNNKLQKQLNSKKQSIAQLQKQIAQDKNETKVLTQKKCKGCELLEQKQKEYFQIYEQNKRANMKSQELKDTINQYADNYKKLDEKYKNLIFLKQQMQKKNVKLIDREKQLSSQIQKMQKNLKEVKQDTNISKQLHIQIQQLKQAKYQIQKSISKMEEKNRRQVADLRLEITGIEQQKNIILSQSQKTKLQLNQIKSKFFKMQFELQSVDESLKIKTIECQQLKKRHIQNMSEQMRKRNGLDGSLKIKEEQLSKAYQIIDQVQNAKDNLLVQYNQQRKASQSKDEQISQQICQIKELQEKLSQMQDKIKQTQQKFRQLEENEYRIKQANQIYTANRVKHTHSTNTQYTSSQNNSLLLRISNKIKQLHYSLSQVAQQNPDSFQKRRGRQDLSDEREQVNLLKTQRFINQVLTQFYNFRNKYDFVFKDNQNLKLQLENEITYKNQQLQQLQKEIDLKEEALRSLISWIPEELRELVVEFLCMTQQLSKDKCHQDEVQFEEYEELKVSLENQGKQWKQNYQKIDRRFKKMEEQTKRLEQQNEQLKKRLKIKDIKRPVQTDYDYRQISKKDIRKKYNIDH